MSPGFDGEATSDGHPTSGSRPWRAARPRTNPNAWRRPPATALTVAVAPPSTARERTATAPPPVLMQVGMRIHSERVALGTDLPGRTAELVILYETPGGRA